MARTFQSERIVRPATRKALASKAAKKSTRTRVEGAGPPRQPKRVSAEISQCARDLAKLKWSATNPKRDDYLEDLDRAREARRKKNMLKKGLVYKKYVKPPPNTTRKKTKKKKVVEEEEPLSPIVPLLDGDDEGFDADMNEMEGRFGRLEYIVASPDDGGSLGQVNTNDVPNETHWSEAALYGKPKPPTELEMSRADRFSSYNRRK